MLFRSKIIKNDQRQLDDQLKELPAKIEALQETAPDISGLKEADLRKQLSELEKEIADKKNDGDQAKIRKRLTLLESELIEIDNEGRKAQININDEIDRYSHFISQNTKTIEDTQEQIKG